MLIEQSKLLPWLAAIRLPDIGPATLRQWVDAFGSMAALFTATTDELIHVGFKPKQITALQQPPWRAAEHDLLWCEQNQCHILTFQDPRYPAMLKETHGAPMVLFVQGDLSLLQQPQLAIVGSRNPTVTGREIAGQFARHLTEVGLLITSGLALGIDAASHLGALSQGGKTLAIVGTGLQTVYPASHHQLAEKIRANGALISEFSPDMPAHASHFPRRNRIISGLSLGVLVVEAALKSGSLITARYANEQGREVFAIPGSIRQPQARGCHQLIRQGAKLVETAHDIIEELSALYTPILPIKEEVISTTMSIIDKKKRAFLAQIGYEVTSFDTIMLRSGLTAGEVSSMLLSLELQGCVKTVQGGYQLK